MSLAFGLGKNKFFSCSQTIPTNAPSAMNLPKFADSANVKVVTRCRPVVNDKSVAQISGDTITLSDNSTDEPIERTFQFDKVFPSNTDQPEFFNDVGKELCDVVLNGFNACILAYGQTSSGKTYSIVGECPETRGIIPLSCEYLFSQATRRSPYFNVTISMSILEIFLNQMMDLGREAVQKLKNFPSSRISYSPAAVIPSPAPPSYSQDDVCIPPPPMVRPASAKDPSTFSPPSQNLVIREESKGKTHLHGLAQITVTSIDEVSRILTEALKVRHSAHTLLNSHSSRSHLVVTFSVTQTSIRNTSNQAAITGSLSVVDLAGSERIKKSHGMEVTTERRREAASINSSLSVLGNVVSSLSGGSSHVPFRDSKLTRVLQSLGLGQGGNSYIILLATLYPLAAHFSETLNTLTFANRCLAIQTGPRVNYNLLDEHSYQSKLRELQDTIVQMTGKINQLQEELSERDERLQMKQSMGVVEGQKDDVNLNYDDVAMSRQAINTINKLENRFRTAQGNNVAALVRQVQRTLKYKNEVVEVSDENSRLLSESRELLSRQNDLYQSELSHASQLTAELMHQCDELKTKHQLEGIRAQTAIQSSRSGLLSSNFKSSKNLNNSKVDGVTNSNYNRLLEQKDSEIAQLKSQISQMQSGHDTQIKSISKEAQKLFKLMRQRDRVINDVITGRLSDHIHFGGIKGRFLDLPVSQKPATFNVSEFKELYKLTSLISDDDRILSVPNFRKRRPRSAAPSWV
ncbi:hypothetical protein GEMRC1_006829 [Eukaryota sp. GEM-RC1]